MTRRNWWPVAYATWAFVAGLVIGWRILADGEHDHSSHRTPTDGSAEVGFARDMSVHHAQAVQMADIIRGRTADQTLRIVATDIVLTQQNQIGRMSAWLETWGVNPTSLDPPMAWMGPEMQAMEGMQLSADGRMPGMASNADLVELITLDVPSAEIKFLQLMITHHYSGVTMAQHAAAMTSDPAVDRLAGSMVHAQYSEIDAMGDLLEARGVARPVAPPMPTIKDNEGRTDDSGHNHGS
jgi:uncharacterized protein (DUF305 family)